MNKRSLHHFWTRLRKVSYWYFLLLAVICGLIAVYSMRQNNLTALRLRDQVLQVDKDNGDVEAALNELRGYIYSHMNAGLASDTSVYPPIQLKYSYDRLAAAEKARVSKINEGIYTAAQKYCERKNPTRFGAPITCIQEYITTHGTAKEQEIPDSLYKFDFASPLWSPDLAGLAIVATALFSLLFIGLLALELWLRRTLRD
jgi:hypothetical protein